MQTRVNQYILTVAAGKRLIAQACLRLPSIQQALQSGTVVITAGTTNSYLAEAALGKLEQDASFDRVRFFRGITLPPDRDFKGEQWEFLGDVVLEKGVWKKGLTIFDVVDQLEAGDIIIKGANAVNLVDQEAAVLIGHSQAGTIGAAILPVIGRRVELIVPIGLEKRVDENIGELAQMLNAADATGPRYFPIKGNIITELRAISILTGAKAKLIAAGGVYGAEGSVRLAVRGTDEQLAQADRILAAVASEPDFITE